MIAAWISAGAVGAALAFVRNPWPAAGMVARNSAVVLLAAVISLGLWLTGLDNAWGLAAGWLGGHVLLQLSHGLVRPGILIWPRALAAVMLIGAVARIWGGSS